MPHLTLLDEDLGRKGERRIEWAWRKMPVLQQVRQEWEKTQPLRGVRIAACLHISAKTANLARVLKAGGAELVLCASNPLSTQDDIAAALNVVYGIRAYARRGVDNEAYYSQIYAALDVEPQITIDDGADLVTTLHEERPGQLGQVIGGTEETTTGVMRLRAMAEDGALKYPVVAVNDALTKHLFDNRYGTGQSALDGFCGRPITCWPDRSSWWWGTAGAAGGLPPGCGVWAPGWWWWKSIYSRHWRP